MKKQDFTVNDYDLKPLPFSDALEAHILCCILDNPDECLPLAMKYLNDKGIFYNVMNEEMWTLIKSTSPFSTKKIHGIYESYRDSKKLNHFLAICRSLPTYSNFHDDCLRINEYWIKRTIHRFGHYLNANSLLNKIDPLELLGIASDSTDKIYQHIARMKEVTIKEGVNELADEIRAIGNSPDGMLGLKGSLDELNSRIKGYRKGNLIAMCGDTGEGKTTLAVQEIRFWIEQNIPVGCCSLEMKISEYVLMMGCDALSIPIEHVLDGTATGEQIAELGRYMERIKKMPLYISDKPAMKIGEIKSLARLWKKNFGIRAFVVDHGHLVEPDIPQTNTEQRFTEIANQFKALAKELDIPIIVLWQLSRKDASDKNPHKSSNIKYAGGIEQACDIVLLIYRPEIHGIDKDIEGRSTKGVARIIIGKLRLLPKGDVKCGFTGTRFVNYNNFQFEQLPVSPITKKDGKKLIPMAQAMNNSLPYKDDTPF